MKIKMFLMISIPLFLFLFIPNAFACGCKGNTQGVCQGSCGNGGCSAEADACSAGSPLGGALSEASLPLVINVGNKVCPVMGNPIQLKDGVGQVTYKYQGRVFNLCCAGCVKVFQGDPEKYSAAADNLI